MTATRARRTDESVQTRQPTNSPRMPAQTTDPVRGRSAQTGAQKSGREPGSPCPGAEWPKVSALFEHAVSCGWDVTILVPVKGCAEVISTRGDEVITAYFMDGNLDVSQMPTHLFGRRFVKLRHISAVKQQMLVPQEEMSAFVNSIVPRKSKAHQECEANRKPSRSVPWREDATDDEIIRAVRGKRLTWRNTITGDYFEEQIVSFSSYLKIVTSPINGKRALNWSVDGGIRSVYVDALIQIH